MHYTKFSSKIKAKYPEYQDMDDRELAQKIVAKYPNDYSDVTFDEPETKQQSKTTLVPLQPVQTAEAKQPKQTTTVLTGGVKKDVEFDPLYQDVIKNDNLTREQKAAEIQRRGEVERAQIDRDLRNYKIRANIGAGLEIASGLIPFGAGAKIATKGLQLARPIGQQVMANLAKRGALEGALSGGVFGIGRGLIEDENVAKTASQDALLGGVTGGLLSGIGTRLGRTGQRIRDIEQRQVQRAARANTPQAVEQAIEQVPMQVVEQVPTQSTQQAVEQAAQTIDNIVPENVPTVEQQSYNGIIGREIPIEPMTPTERLDVIYNENTAKETQNALKQNIESLKAPKTEKTTISLRYKNRYYKRNIDDPLTKGIQDADAEINSILDEIKKNPEVVNDANKIAEFEQRLAKKVDFNDDELNQSYYTKLYQALNTGNDINQVNRSLDAANELRKSGEIKKSRLAQNADLPPEMRTAIEANPPEYQVLHNRDLIAQAQANVSSNFEGTKNRLFNLKDNLSAQDFEEARQVISRLYNEGNTDEALRLTEQMTQAATKAGRTVQALSLWSRTTPEGAVRQAQKLINEYNKKHNKKIPKLTEKQVNDIQQLSNNIQKSTTDEEREIATALLMKYQAELLPAEAMDKVKTVRNIALLLNAKTFARNITGNALVAGLEQGLTKPLAAGVDRLMSLGTKEQTRSLPQLREYFQGLWQGFKKGTKDVALGIDTRNKIGQRYDLPNRRSFTDPVFGNIEKALNWSLQVPDRAFYEATFKESVANQLRARGLTEPTDEILQNATNEALEAVFQNDSALSNTVLGLRRALNKAGNLGDWLIPYAQTPANVVQMGINYSPLGLIKGGITAARGNQRQASLDLARGLVGSGIYGLGALGASSGIISRPQDDYQIRKNYESLGVRPNQINIGDVGISYSQLQPLAAGLSGGVALSDITNADADPAKVADKSLSTVADLSMLRGLNNFYDDLSRSGIGTAIANAYTGVPSQFVPTLLNQANAYIDPYQRETYSPNSLQQGLNQAIAKIPFASQALPYRYDVTGQRVKKYESEGWGKAFDVFLNPVFVNKRKDDPVMNELASLYERSGEKSGFLPVAEKKIKYRNLKGDMVDKKLTGKELSTYQKELGQVNYALMNRIMQTNLYNNLGDDEKIKLLQSIKNNTKSVVDEKLFGKPNAAKQRMIKRLTEDARQEAIDEVLKEVKKVFPQMAEKYYNEIGG